MHICKIDFQEDNIRDTLLIGEKFYLVRLLSDDLEK